jgi:hypothetical protein
MQGETQTPSHRTQTPVVDDDLQAHWSRAVGRRGFLAGIGTAGAAAVTGGLWATAADAAGEVTAGDVAILRFLAAAEILETDLWQQYNELAAGNPAYMAALQNLDDDMPEYIADNTDDELSHGQFLNAYLESKGAPPVNLEQFRTLPSSTATGAAHKHRLTNLRHLNVDTSWYTRYRSRLNPDFGATFPQAVTIANEPAIPLNDTDTPPNQAQPIPPSTRNSDACRRSPTRPHSTLP